ncbi:A24 family peptidase [Thalassobacillus hwangdonensis]|uniref:Prepilin peptidase n=1 Tax=Thalassobacillus hwangdonensis TaxID=546108 RepID=A0ABW3KUY5_9BACI
MEVNHYIFIALIIIAFIWDVKFQKIPNWLTASGMVIGIIYHLIAGGLDGFLFACLGLLVAGGIFMLLYLFKAIGAGDVKLFAAIGALTGIEFSLYLMMYSIIFAGLIGIIILLFSKTFLRKMLSALTQLLRSIKTFKFEEMEEYKQKHSTRFPFMYAVVPAVITTYYYMF